MFGFFKKKEKETAEVVETALTEEEKQALTVKLQELTAQIEAADPAEKEELAQLHEQLGLTYAELEETEQAIKELESSLEYKLTIKDGYKKLMSLYNAKRAEAARNGDDAGIDYYMGKMDDMRQIAKKVTISG
ncbi:tetratricopeptide repeat protein [Candidatus Enterococcus ferrettii]|uniref:Tetratricopeptide repeat protein n=1 Tax=Candidatus Enterococcus ferrettii TaxID=2815324 RepID=A0ABV0EKB8_9ENTE|nr:tetratricopeptide repeat protein [Enterococcus sp. 665A]MBO1341597.1 tetratricopeptide repeat protein [Enterococcus sp. 665A]